MIKRIVFAAAGDAPATTATTLAVVPGAPAGVRPHRAVTCVAVPGLIADQRHPALSMAWFGDGDHLARYERWLADRGGPVGAAGGTEVVVVDEHVLRGRQWLDARWAAGGPRLKHMALARRARGLTQSQFSQRWQRRAGRVGATPIPELARGCAYAQDHPVARAGGDWCYDAVNEVWFDDEDALRARIEWMEEAVGSGAEDDLVRESSFLAVREEVVIGDA